MVYNRILILCFFALVVFNGCHCKKTEPVPEEKELNAFQYFPDNNNKQWIYEVYKTNYTINPPKSEYVYDDTLYFVKDSTLTKDSLKPIKFKFYDFKKKHDYKSFTIGKFPFDNDILLLFIDNVASTLYDLSNMASKGPSQNFNSDGLPINNRVKASYSSPYIYDYQTALGNFKTIFSAARYLESSANVYLRYSHTFTFADGIGPVRYSFDYEYKNPLINITDSLFSVDYRIKKVVN